MRITHEDDDGERKTLRIEAPWSDIAADYQDLVARYARVRIPGFRPGKVPRPVIEHRFRKEILADLSALITERLAREATREGGIGALGPLEVTEIECDTGKPFCARIRYLPMPEFQLPDLAGLKTEDNGADARDRISRRLLELVQFKVPDEMVRMELELDGLGQSTPDSDAWAAATDRIKLMIILKKIAREEGIEVEETHVNNRIEEKAEEFGTSKDGLRQELAKGGGLERLKDMLLAESTLGFLMEMNRK